MTQSIDFEEIIHQGIKELPRQYLSEIADFVTFIRHKAIEEKGSYNFEDINRELGLMSTHETNHLEEEFKDFDQKFPKE